MLTHTNYILSIAKPHRNNTTKQNAGKLTLRLLSAETFVYLWICEVIVIDNSVRKLVIVTEIDKCMSACHASY